AIKLFAFADYAGIRIAVSIYSLEGIAESGYAATTILAFTKYAEAAGFVMPGNPRRRCFMADAEHAIEISAFAHNAGVVTTKSKHPLKGIADADHASIAFTEDPIAAGNVFTTNGSYSCIVGLLRYSHLSPLSLESI
ncbi:MAG TPA: hypothetical protein VKD91_04670, partial [Pyrinomonadaceae bacterium]|nr:hypothetical protein [Pyrinomonadaceae bacterium]